MAGKVNSLTESGILSAVTVVMALIAVYVPLLGIVAVLLWPVPMIVLIVRHGLKWGILSIITAGILTAVLIEPVTAIRLVIAFAPCGIALGMGYRMRYASTTVFTGALVVSIVSKVAALALAFYLTGIHPFEGQFEMMDASFSKSVEMYKSLNFTPEQIKEAGDNFRANMDMVRQLLPLIVILMGMLDTAVNFIVGGKVLKRLGNDVVTFPPFKEWRISPFFAYLYGFSLIGMYWGMTRNISLLHSISFNANMLATMAGVLQGLVLYECVVTKYRISRIVSTIMLFFICFNAVFMQLLAFIGIFDMAFDYRRRFNL